MDIPYNYATIVRCKKSLSRISVQNILRQLLLNYLLQIETDIIFPTFSFSEVMIPQEFGRIKYDRVTGLATVYSPKMAI